MDDILSAFMSIADTDDVDASKRILEMSNWSIDAAVDLLFESGGIDAFKSNTTVDHHNSTNTTLTDEQLARSLQEQSYKGYREADDHYQDQLIQGGWGVEEPREVIFQGFATDITHDPKGISKLFAPPSYRFK